MLCRSYEADEQLLGSHLVHRHLSADPTMPQAPIWLVRSLAHSGDAKVAEQAQRLLVLRTSSD